MKTLTILLVLLSVNTFAAGQVGESQSLKECKEGDQANRVKKQSVESESTKNPEVKEAQTKKV